MYLREEPVPSPDTISRKNVNSSYSTAFPPHGEQHTLHVNTTSVLQAPLWTGSKVGVNSGIYKSV